jgi:hypothetical protein
MDIASHRPPIDVKGAALYSGMSEGYLNKLRCTGGGPVFIKRKGVVRYDPADLDAWLAAGKCKSTSDTREVA